MILHIDQVDEDAGTFAWTLFWPTIKNSVTNGSGQINGQTLTWQENTLVVGQEGNGGIDLGGQYEASVNRAGALVGTWRRTPNANRVGAMYNLRPII